MILYTIAMESEAKDIISDSKYKLIENTKYELYKFDNILVAITKIGKVNAAYVVTDIINKYGITSIVNLGFAGAVGKFNIGEIVKVKSACYHDFDLTVFGYLKGQVPNLPQKLLSNEKMSSLIDYHEAEVYTGDYFMTEIREGNYLVDMEAMAIYQVAYLANLPVVSIKIVSDIIGSSDHIDEYFDFEKNGSLEIKKVFQKLNEVIK